MKIINKVESPLLHRTEVIALADHIGRKTLDYKEVKDSLVKELKVDEKLLVVKNIHGIFGKGYSKVKAYVYKDEDSLNKIEEKPKVKKENVQESKTQEQINK